MLFQLFSILFLIAQCAAVTEITMVTKSPSEKEMMTDVLELLNDPRRSLIHDTNASNLYLLKWDMSLAWLAFKASETCDALNDSDGFMKMRLTLSDKKVTIATDVTQHRLITDFWNDISDFGEHIKEKGAKLSEFKEEFSKFYDYFRSDWTQIGCVFKACKDVMTGEDTNLNCFLGPKSEKKPDTIFEVKDSRGELCKDCECDKLACKPPKFDGTGLTDEEFQKKVLGEFNGARSAFATKANVAAMSKLVWDDTLAAAANDAGSKCETPTHGSNYREIVADMFIDIAAGLAEIGKMYGSTTKEESYKEVYDWSSIYTILWPKMTKVGCGKAPKCTNKIWCHFGEIGVLDGKMYEKGQPCSKCNGGCEKGLCA